MTSFGWLGYAYSRIICDGLILIISIIYIILSDKFENTKVIPSIT